DPEQSLKAVVVLGRADDGLYLWPGQPPVDQIGEVFKGERHHGTSGRHCAGSAQNARNSCAKRSLSLMLLAYISLISGWISRVSSCRRRAAQNARAGTA